MGKINNFEEVKFVSMKIFIIFFSLLFSFSASYAEVVKNLIIDGNKRISDETIKIYGGIEINKDYKDSDLG